jgi:hypothetical protein
MRALRDLLILILYTLLVLYIFKPLYVPWGKHW